ncbi:hypothetical protein TSUD_161720 [Trifolium subterraneum]|uniref:Protein kinase domain-containing protein n=1 Tax=Trifolium subterraneum TaxID=3900 RepID=A0A2Z6NJ55_TRISU|nr:hypothetical protein TSUD_161720 [Trifolium subterraneum]
MNQNWPRKCTDALVHVFGPIHNVDVYSFGIILWELITGMLTFQNIIAVQAAFAVVQRNACPILPNDCLPILCEIMTRCWDANPDVRPPFTEIVEIDA